MPLGNGRVLSPPFSALMSQQDVFNVGEATANLRETDQDQDRVRPVKVQQEKGTNKNRREKKWRVG